MPFPLLLIIGGASAGVSAFMASEAKDVVVARIKRKLSEVGPAALDESFKRMGLNVDLSGGLNDETLTNAINGTLLAGTGIVLSSIFDREKLKRDLSKLAVQKAAEQFGLAGVSTEAGLRGELLRWIQGEVEKQLVEGGEILAQAVKDKFTEKVAEQKLPEVPWNTPVDFSPKGIANRERQARYRANHKRTWVLKNAGGEA